MLLMFYHFVVDHVLVLIALAAGVFIGASALGYLSARKRVGEYQLAPVQGAVLGLTGLLLGFSISLALSRYDHRRVLVVREANAIGTTWLRTDLLPAPLGSEARPLLERYVGARLAFFRAGDHERAIAKAEAQAAGLQTTLWAIATKAAVVAPNSITARFIQALNGMIDVEAERDAARRDRLPWVMWGGLFLVTMVASFFTGAALAGQRWVVLLVLPLTFALLLGLIGEFDTPRNGLVQISQHSLERLQASFAPHP